MPAKVETPPVAFYAIAVVVTVFVMLGLVMVLSASSIRLINSGDSPWAIFQRQVLWASLGTAFAIGLSKANYQRWRGLVRPGLFVTMAMMFLPFVPGIGAEINGAAAWVDLGVATFQPSEFLKLAVLLYCADLLTRREHELADRGRTVKPLVAVAGVAAGLCVLQNDLGSAIVLASIALSVAFVAGIPLSYLALITAGGAVITSMFVLSSSRRLARFTSFLDIEGNREHLGYQQFQAMIAIAQGGATGAGPGRGPNKLGDFLPLAHSDFIFAVIAEELGLLGAIAVLGGFAVIAVFGVQVAIAAPDRFGTLLAGGVVAWFVVQTLINVGGVTGIMPVTGLTLPFFSAGGSSLFVSMVAIGVLLSVARRTR